jgi:hypothetical protein
MSNGKHDGDTVPGLNGAGRRREDHDTVARVFNFFVKFHWLATILFAFFLMLGFGFKTPQASFAEINARITKNWIVDSVALIELREVDKQSTQERAYLKQMIESLVIMECRRNARSAQDNRLPCRRLYREWGLE